VPCHPGRPNIGLYEHYLKKPVLENVIAVETAQRRIAQGRK